MINIDKINKVVNEYFLVDNRIIAVYLHGSYSKNRTHPNSDIDLAILLKPNKKINSRELLTISADIEVLLNSVIDLGVISSKNLVYAKEVIYNGQCLICKDKYKKELYEATLLCMYTDFQYERREVLNAYKK